MKSAKTAKLKIGQIFLVLKNIEKITNVSSNKV